VVARQVSINAFARQPRTVPNLEYGRYTRVYTRDYRSRVASLLVHVPGASGPGHQIAFPLIYNMYIEHICTYLFV
jgi:hypothetical protein